MNIVRIFAVHTSNETPEGLYLGNNENEDMFLFKEGDEAYTLGSFSKALITIMHLIAALLQC